jgi:hypothetical protein
MRRGIRAASSTTGARRTLLAMPFIGAGLLAILDQARRRELPHAFVRFIPRGVRPPERVVVATGNAAAAHALLLSEWVVLFVGAAASVAALATLAKRCPVRLPAIASGRGFSWLFAALLTVMALCAIAGSLASMFHGVTFSAIGAPGVPTTPLPPGVRPVSVKITVAAPHWQLLAIILSVASVVSAAGWRSSRHAERVLTFLSAY